METLELQAQVTIKKASHMGMCFGVRDAIDLVEKRASKAKVTVLGDLVHNATVLEDLEAQGVQFERDPNALETPEVIITAHGASESRIQSVRAEGFNVTEATCPLVKHAHGAVLDLQAAGYYPVVIGRKGHVEINGLTGDLRESSVILDEDEIEGLPARPKYGIAAQTTQPLEKVERMVGLIRRQFPRAEVKFVDTVCRPTKQRQQAVVDLARSCDVVIVIGGANSNNTHQLMLTSQRFCGRVHHVLSAADLQEMWFRNGDTIGITAGTSTPDVLIEGGEDWLKGRFDVPAGG